MNEFFALYDTLLSGMDGADAVTSTVSGQCWTAVETKHSFGMAMTTQGDTAPRMLGGDYDAMPLKELAQACISWNLREAGFGLAAVNAYYNTPERLKRLHAYEPFENYCTAGLDLAGARAQARALEATCAACYEELATLSHGLLATIPRAFRRAGQKRQGIAAALAADGG